VLCLLASGRDQLPGEMAVSSQLSQCLMPSKDRVELNASDLDLHTSQESALFSQPSHHFHSKCSPKHLRPTRPFILLHDSWCLADSRSERSVSLSLSQMAPSTQPSPQEVGKTVGHGHSAGIEMSLAATEDKKDGVPKTALLDHFGSSSSDSDNESIVKNRKDRVGTVSSGPGRHAPKRSYSDFKRRGGSAEEESPHDDVCATDFI